MKHKKLMKLVIRKNILSKKQQKQLHFCKFMHHLFNRRRKQTAEGAGGCPPQFLALDEHSSNGQSM